MSKASILPPLRLVFLIWLFFSVEVMLNVNLGWLGIRPRSLEGAVGILTAPLIHGSLSHILSNTLPLLSLGVTLFYFYGKVAPRVFLQCYFLTNFLVWCFARTAVHVGASGLIYGLAAFLISIGFFQRNFFSLLISLVVILFYGGMAYGLFPFITSSYVSWESHLFGAIVGVWSAYSISQKTN